MHLQAAATAIFWEAFRVLHLKLAFLTLTNSQPPPTYQTPAGCHQGHLPGSLPCAAPRRRAVHHGDGPHHTRLCAGAEEPVRLHCVQEHRALAAGQVWRVVEGGQGAVNIHVAAGLRKQKSYLWNVEFVISSRPLTLSAQWPPVSLPQPVI